MMHISLCYGIKRATTVERDELKPFGFGGELDVCRSSFVGRVPLLRLLRSLTDDFRDIA